MEDVYPYAAFDRAGYLAATGEQAPPFDTTKPVKQWYRPLGGTENADTQITLHYGSFDNVKATVVDKQVTAGWAASVNLEGHYNWPVYSPAPSNSYIKTAYNPSAQGTLITTDQLATEDQAKATAALFGGVAYNDRSPKGQIYAQYADGEARRMWTLTLTDPANGHTFEVFVGLLLRYQNQFGVGCPGHFVVIGNSVNWSSDEVTKRVDGQAVEPRPIRAPADNEVLGYSPFSGYFYKVKQPDTQDTSTADVQDIKAMLLGLQAQMNRIEALITGQPVG